MRNQQVFLIGISPLRPPPIIQTAFLLRSNNTGPYPVNNAASVAAEPINILFFRFMAILLILLKAHDLFHRPNKERHIGFQSMA